MNLITHLHLDPQYKTHFIFGYTPFCGTCKLAERMLDIVKETKSIPLTKIDLNYHEIISQYFQIYSVPVLLIVRDGNVIESIYKFESILNILDIIKKYID